MYHRGGAQGRGRGRDLRNRETQPGSALEETKARAKAAKMRYSLTNLVKLERSEVGTVLLQQLLGGSTVGAVALGEDDNAVLVDEGLSLGLSGGHGGGRWSGEGAEETLEDERNGGRNERKKPGEFAVSL